MDTNLTRRQALGLIAAGTTTLLLGGCAGSRNSSLSYNASSASSESVTASSSAAAANSSAGSSAISAAGKTLVVYYSLPEVANPSKMTEEGENSTVAINGEILGNVQYLAQLIADQTKGEIARIEAVEPYPIDDHQELIDIAQKELDSGTRRKIKGAPTNDQIKNADTIFIGYPIWWADLPTPMYTFLESEDLSGKTIVPFTCHGGSGFSGTRETLAQLQAGADVLADEGFSVSRDDVEDSAGDVAEWLDGLGFKR